jgi:hypothetical protein
MTDGSSATRCSVIELKAVRKSHTQRVLGVRAVSTSVVARGAVTTAAGISVVARGAVTTATATSVVARVAITTTCVLIVIARRTLVLVAIMAKISLVVPIIGAAPFDRRSLHGEDDGGEEECDGRFHILSIEKRVWLVNQESGRAWRSTTAHSLTEAPTEAGMTTHVFRMKVASIPYEGRRRRQLAYRRSRCHVGKETDCINKRVYERNGSMLPKGQGHDGD